MTLNKTIYAVIAREPQQALLERFGKARDGVNLTRLLRRGRRNGVIEIQREGYCPIETHPLARLIRQQSETGA